LKTEKTEFQHIDELIRRIALSSFHITFVLKHNGKIIRQYRAAQTDAQKTKRLGSICSDNFVRSAIYFKNDENELKISGWVSDSHSPRSLSDVQYCYINGRMIKDKLVTHAIKQAYAYRLPDGKFPGFVIYITCPLAEVDVNVHPAKHEVRFHQARWVHDFIVSTLLVTLNESDLSHENNITTDNTLAIQNRPESHDYQSGPAHATSNSTPSASSYGGNYQKKTALKTALDEPRINAYCDFVTQAVDPIVQINKGDNTKSPSTQSPGSAFGDIMCLFENSYLLLRLNQNQKMISTSAAMMVLSLNAIDKTLKELQLISAYEDGEIIAQPLLLPVRVELNTAQYNVLSQYESIFVRLGFVFRTQGNKLIINRVPALLRVPPMAPIASIFVKLITYLMTQDKAVNQFEIIPFCTLLSCLALPENERAWDMPRAQALLNKAINWPAELFSSNTMFIEADLSLLVKGFQHA
ncbi:MAG: DNA mismatch repair protein MutL, partial [Psychromonas sp.]|nr:DNA mismatch repair protein MutL [Psychromonas sp.]